jgi:hypothetical protein
VLIHAIKFNFEKESFIMGVKLTDKNKNKGNAAPANTAAPAQNNAPVNTPANTPADNAGANAGAAPAETAKKTVTIDGKKIVPTSGVFMISSPDNKFKYIGSSTRIEVCIKDYFKWLADGKHGSKEMQEAYDKNGKKLNWSILKECEKADFVTEKAKACKQNGVDMKVPFSKDVIKSKDIQV